MPFYLTTRVISLHGAMVHPMVYDHSNILRDPDIGITHSSLCSWWKLSANVF